MAFKMGDQKKSGGMGSKAKGKSGGGGFGGKKTMGFSAKVGKNHKSFGKDMSPAGGK